MPVHMLLDSSAMHSFGAAFRRLQTLVSENIVKVYISEVVQQEISSHLKGEFVQKINDGELGIRKIIKHDWLKYAGDITALHRAQDLILLVKEKVNEFADQGVRELFQSVQAEILSIQPHHGNLVMNSYFSGNPPFKSPKSRNDIPDAFIFESARDLKVRFAGEVLHFVVADKALRNSLAQIEGVVLHENLDEFIRCDEVENLVRYNELEEVWGEVYKEILPSLPSLEDAFISSIQAIVYELTWKELHHPQIPDDNNEAFISLIQEPEDVTFDWENIRNYGSGLITIPFEFDALSEIQFSVFRGEAYALDENIYIEHKDPETNHYFDASGTVVINVIGTISAQFESKKVEGSELIELLQEVQFSEIKIIDIKENESGKIFV